MNSLLDTNIHDPQLYDPERHDNQIVAVFDDDAAASLARDALRDAGLPDSAIQLVAAPATDAAATEAQPVPKSAGDQIMNAFMGLLSAGEEHHDYAHAIRRGHAMVVVTPTADTDRHLVVTVLERSNPIDFDAKLEEWRQTGYERMKDQERGERRLGRREPLASASRVRSYIAERPAGAGGGPAAMGTNVTPGVESSGMNAPRR